MRRTRPTICPTRPKPQMITGACSSIASNRSAWWRARRGSTSRSLPANSSGVAAMETAITSVARSASGWDSAPAATAAANITKLNSLPCGRAVAKRTASAHSSGSMSPRPT